MTKTELLTGQCMCGKVKFTIKGDVIGIVNCHCHDCQRLHGNYNPMVITDKENLLIDQGQEFLRSYESSNTAVRQSCSNCGSQMFKVQTQGPKAMISVGNIDNLNGYNTIKNIYTESAGDYYILPTTT
jgi:hypothetical protein